MIRASLYRHENNYSPGSSSNKSKLGLLTEPMPDPDQIWLSRAESFKARADDLMWLSGSIIEDQTHEVTGDELLTLGIMGSVGKPSLDLFEDEPGE